MDCRVAVGGYVSERNIIVGGLKLFDPDHIVDHRL